MSGHCQSCGTYHEEDDGRACASCRSRKKRPSPAAGWAVLYPELAARAMRVGYALCCHGSFGRDLDIVAVPWTNRAVPRDELVKALCEGLAIKVADGSPLRRPHGRHAYSLIAWTGPYSIDLSVMPTQAVWHTCEEQPTCEACEWDAIYQDWAMGGGA